MMVSIREEGMMTVILFNLMSRIASLIATYLDTSMRTEVEVELGWMGDSNIDSGSSRNVTRFADLFSFVLAEETCMMSLLNNDKSNTRSIVFFQLHACLSNRDEFMHENLMELAFRNSIPVEDDPVWLEAS